MGGEAAEGRSGGRGGWENFTSGAYQTGLLQVNELLVVRQEIFLEDLFGHGSNPEGVVELVAWFFLPKVGIENPLAATRLEDCGQSMSWKDVGKSHSSAPESTRKTRLDLLSTMDIVPKDLLPTTVTCGWPGRFLGQVWRPLTLG